MNERIRQLWMESDTEHHNPPALAWAEKFAQQVIAECVKVCYSRVGSSEYNTGRMHSASDIKDHFGIER